MSLQWENLPYSEKFVAHSDLVCRTHYILYIDSIQIAIVPNNINSLNTCCSIAGLKPCTQYQIDLVTINNRGFVNKLPPIFLKTKENYETNEEGNKSLKFYTNGDSSKDIGLNIRQYACDKGKHRKKIVNFDSKTTIEIKS